MPFGINNVKGNQVNSPEQIVSWIWGGNTASFLAIMHLNIQEEFLFSLTIWFSAS